MREIKFKYRYRVNFKKEYKKSKISLKDKILVYINYFIYNKLMSKNKREINKFILNEIKLFKD